MTVRRIGLVSSSGQSNWISCQAIVPNLEVAYRQAFGERLKAYSLNEEMREGDLCNLALQISRDRPSRLIFVDHRPHPIRLLRWLRDFYGSAPLPELVFHVYGDFTFHSGAWMDLRPLLLDSKVRFVCASERQGQLLTRFLKDGNSSISICPFPVDTEIFHFDPKARGRYRKQLGLSDHEILIAYAGRLSLQKNVTRLVKEFAELLPSERAPMHLVLAGSFDDIGAPFFGINSRMGYCFQQWQSILNEFSSKVRSRIHYVGSLEPQELAGLYCGADLFASLSLHHDEDFGMAPAEALCCGTPVVLTNWGGYASFSGKSCELVPVRIHDLGLTVCSKDFRAALLRQCQTSLSNGDRKKMGQRFSARYSIPAVGDEVRKISRLKSPKFRGFNWRMQKYAQSNTGNGAHFPSGPTAGTFYEEIYGVYVGAAQ